MAESSFARSSPSLKKKSFQGPKRDLRADTVFCQLQHRGLTWHTVGTERGTQGADMAHGGDGEGVRGDGGRGYSRHHFLYLKINTLSSS